MTHYNEEKALVLYVPPCEEEQRKRFNIFTLFARINLFFKSRANYYYLLLSVFSVVSVLSRCIHLRLPDFGNGLITDTADAFMNGDYFSALITGNVGLGLLLLCVSFLSAFTVFALPVTLVSAIHYYYISSYFFFALIDKVFEKSFPVCFSIIALFVVTLLASTVFFTETMLFYKKRTHPFKTGDILSLGMAFTANAFIYCFSLYFILSLFLS